MTRRRALLLALSLLGPCAQAQEDEEPPAFNQEEAPPFNREDYPEYTLAQVLVEEPCRPDSQGREIKDRTFSAELVFQGGTRETPAKRFALVSRWAAQLGDPAAAERYRKEIPLVEGKKVHWIPVPEGLLPLLDSDLQPGDRLLAYLVFVGCVNRSPVFSLDEFETLEPDIAEDEDTIVFNEGVRHGPHFLSGVTAVLARAKRGRRRHRGGSPLESARATSLPLERGS